MLRSRRFVRAAFAPLLPLAIALSVGSIRAAEHHHDAPASAIVSAVAVLVPGSGSQVSGTVRFTAVEGGVRVEADVKGLTPGSHGFHVHEKGDVSKPDLTSAGGHFNPTGHPHAARTASERHVGDLGNLEADASGHATVDFVDSQLQLTGPNSIVGRAVIIHAKADDLKSQPTGDAGGRVAGGVIGVTGDAKSAGAK